MPERQSVTLDVDDIDHLTIRRRRGQDFDCGLARVYIRRSFGVYPETHKANPRLAADYSAIEEAGEQELYDTLVAIRTVLMRSVGLA
ncbi:MAG: hypothetical protein IK118_05745 [Clostridia bacterium]|nr:hypothetical protein [Clostridia bacterium]